MTVLLRSGILRLCSGAAGIFALAAGTELEAQAGRSRPCTAPSTILIAFPRAPDVATGTAVRDLVWSTFKDFGSAFCLVPKDAVDDLLTKSSFSTTAVLSAVDAVNLAQPLRADEVLEFEVVPVGRSIQLNGRIILTRERQGLLRDSIPKHEAGDNRSLVAKNFLFEVKRVQAMIELEKQCYQAARDERWAEAEAAARRALAAMPTSNIARMCLASSLREARRNSPEVIRLTDEVLAKDPGNALALQLQLLTHLAEHDSTRYAEVGGRIISANPSSPLAEDIIANLAQWRRTEIVLRLLETALREDPENPTLRRIEFRVILASDNLRLAQTRGTALANLDTAVVDTAFIYRMVNAFARDSNPQRAAEWLARGTAKFPNDIELAKRLAQQLRALGQTDQAVNEYKRILTLNPKAPEIRLQIGNTYNAAGKVDSAFAWFRRAVEAGDDKTVAGTLIAAIANGLLTAAGDTTGGKMPTAEGYKRVIPFAAYADTLDNLTGKFLWGLTAYRIAFPMLQALQTPGAATCPALKEVRDWVVLANEKVLAGARAQPTFAGQLLPNLTTMMDYIDGVAKALKPPCTFN